MEMIWKEPPPQVSSKYAGPLAELKKYPGRWALVVEAASTSSAAEAWKKLGCEAKVHRKNPGEKPPRYEVYARWPERKINGQGGHAMPDDIAKRMSAGGPAVTVKTSAGGTYDPLGRAARGIPPEGVHPAALRR